LILQGEPELANIGLRGGKSGGKNDEKRPHDSTVL
jgi:hypothetical protein